MEHPSTDPRKISRDQKNIGAAERNVPLRARQGTKLRDILMSDKPKLSYADFHHEITRDPNHIVPEYIGSHQSHQLFKEVTPKEEELVRYMSHLPSYLEKGRDFQEKALNVGVLDWKRLEKWRNCQKQMAHNKHNGYSPSSSNASLFSTDDLSTTSSRGQSCSPAGQRMHRLSLHSPRETSPEEGHVQNDKYSSKKGLESHPEKVYAGGVKFKEIDVFGRTPRMFEDLPVNTGNHLSRQQKVLSALQRCDREKPTSEIGQCSGFDKFELAAPWKGKTKIQGSECAKQTLSLQETQVGAPDGNFFRREKTGAPSRSEKSCFVEADGKAFSGKYGYEKSLPCKMNDRNHPEPTGFCSQNSKSMKNSSHGSQVSLHSTKMFHSPSKLGVHGGQSSSQASNMLQFPSRMISSPTRSRKVEEKRPAVKVGSASNPLEEFGVRKNCESTSKTRNPSPIRRLSFAMGRMMKNAGSRENSPLRKSSSKECVPKSGLERDSTSFSIDNPCSDKSLSNNNRGRSSPLRRLLDPLLKSRPSYSAESPKKHSSIAVGSKNRCNEQSVFCAEHSVKDKFQDGSNSLQALLQVSFKNGLPLFTFAIDNESDILAATVRKSFVPGKGHHNWTYTFFTVREVKRKSGIWLNQGGKGDGHGCVPNVVAQMKVSDSHENGDDNFTREFDLFAVDVGLGDQHATDFHPTHELAAIVVKLPRTSVDLSKDGDSNHSWLDSSEVFRENLQDMRSSTGSDADLTNHHSVGSSNLSTTVILPGGVHTVPSKGEVSKLAQRWRSGGCCDCGGWDLGCQLRVYTNTPEPERQTGSSTTCLNKYKFQLFPQVSQDNQPILSLATFKERIDSVELNPSLSLLQAFAVCISYIDSRRPAELSEPDHHVGEKCKNEIGVFEVPMKSDHQVGAPVRYVSYPPHSPVGRV